MRKVKSLWKWILKISTEALKKATPYYDGEYLYSLVEGWSAFNDLGIRYVKVPKIMNVENFQQLTKHSLILKEDMPKVYEIFGGNLGNAASYASKFMQPYLMKYTTEVIVDYDYETDGAAWVSREVLRNNGLNPNKAHQFVAVIRNNNGKSICISKGLAIPTDKIESMIFHVSTFKGGSPTENSYADIYFYKENSTTYATLGMQILNYASNKEYLFKKQKEAYNDINNMTDEKIMGDDFHTANALIKLSDDLKQHPYYNRKLKMNLVKRCEHAIFGGLKVKYTAVAPMETLKEDEIAIWSKEDLPDYMFIGRSPVLSPEGIVKVKVRNLRDNTIIDKYNDNTYSDVVYVNHTMFSNRCQGDEDGDYAMLIDTKDFELNNEIPKWHIWNFDTVKLHIDENNIETALIRTHNNKSNIGTYTCTLDYYLRQKDYGKAKLFSILVHNTAQSIKKEIVPPKAVTDMITDKEFQKDVLGYPPIYSFRKHWNSVKAFYNRKRFSKNIEITTSDFLVDELITQAWFYTYDILQSKQNRELELSQFSDMFGEGKKPSEDNINKYRNIEKAYIRAVSMRVKKGEDKIKIAAIKAVFNSLDELTLTLEKDEIIWFWRDYHLRSKEGAANLVVRMITTIAVKAVEYKKTTRISINVSNNGMPKESTGTINNNILNVGNKQYIIYRDQMRKIYGINKVEIINVKEMSTLNKKAKSLKITLEPVE